MTTIALTFGVVALAYAIVLVEIVRELRAERRAFDERVWRRRYEVALPDDNRGER